MKLNVEEEHLNMHAIVHGLLAKLGGVCGNELSANSVNGDVQAGKDSIMSPCHHEPGSHHVESTDSQGGASLSQC